jgi:Protein of unknown function (DUF1592)/Protein of unknown function (DUF1588)/Protein of unknown function (DUF1595)/Protein of unknown function (DUF1585)/Protein of unknown function (DUF1587)
MLKLVAGAGLVLLTLTACEGSIEGPRAEPGPGGVGGSGGVASGGPRADDPNAAGPRPLSRLTRREYDNTVRDLLGDDSRPASAFADDHDRAFSFRRAGLVATQDADLLSTAAAVLAERAMASPASVLPCTAASGEAACASKFIAELGLKAYRRPLSEPETQRLTALYENARGVQQMSFEAAIQLLLEAILQSPAFLYHWESPYASRVVEQGVVKLAGYDVASRLSYFIWGSMPDQALFEAAAGGKLSTDAEIGEQARRMLADPKARDATAAFFREWLELDQIAALPKSDREYPQYTDELKQAMLGETSAFVQSVIFEGGGKLETLLSADFSFSNQSLSAVYGGSAVGSELTRSPLDTGQRRGLLTQPAFLTLSGAPDGSHPVKRGKAVYVKLMCGVLPPPPANVPPAQPASAGGTTRQRFAAHDQNACATGCHALMDPLGFAFEHYDGIGRYRTTDNGQPVDASGKIPIDGVEHAFADATQLTQLLATSDTVRQCFSKQWFRFAMSRLETEADAASLSSIAAAFAKNQFDVRDLAPAIASSRSFRYRSLAAGEPTP